MSYNSGVIELVISNHSPNYSLNCTPLSPITITNSNCKRADSSLMHTHLSLKDPRAVKFTERFPKLMNRYSEFFVISVMLLEKGRTNG